MVISNIVDLRHDSFNEISQRRMDQMLVDLGQNTYLAFITAIPAAVRRRRIALPSSLVSVSHVT